MSKEPQLVRIEIVDKKTKEKKIVLVPTYIIGYGKVGKRKNKSDKSEMARLETKDVPNSKPVKSTRLGRNNRPTI